MSQHKHHNRKEKLQRRAKLLKVLGITLAAIAVAALIFFGVLEIVAAQRQKQAAEHDADLND